MGGTVITSRHLQPIPRTSITEEIVKRLVDLILEEGLKPGDKLPSERELMEQLSVGRSSLREAIKILKALGVVQVSVGEGMFVGQGDLSQISQPLTLGLLMGDRSRNELIETRRLLEVELAGLAAQRASEEERASIAVCLEVMRTSQNRPKEYAQADLEFHLAIARAAHNEILYRLLYTLRYVVGDLITKTVVHYDANHMPQSFRVHIPVYEAIKARDPAAARQAMAAHLDRLEERLDAAIAGNQARRDQAAAARQRQPRARTRAVGR